MEGAEGRRATESSGSGGAADGASTGAGRLSALQEQLIWSLLSSGLSREVLIQALGELEQERSGPSGVGAGTTVAGSSSGSNGGGSADKADRGDGESSEEGEEFLPPIYRDLERLPPEEAARQRAEVDHLLQ